MYLESSIVEFLKNNTEQIMWYESKILRSEVIYSIPEDETDEYNYENFSGKYIIPKYNSRSADAIIMSIIPAFSHVSSELESVTKKMNF